jgi:prevent-host-death family protein
MWPYLHLYPEAKERIMPKVGMRELKKRTSEILRAVREEGAEYIITYQGRPSAVLLPIDEEEEVMPRVPEAQSIAQRVARLVASIPSLEAVYVRARPWGLECWLVANQSTEEERFRLYDLEWDFMEQSPNLGFKFNLVDREGRPLSEVMSVEDFDAVTQLGEMTNA